MSAQVFLAIIIAVSAAFFFSVSHILVRASIGNTTPTKALFISITVNAAALWILSFFLYDVEFDIWQWRYFIAAGLFAPVLGRFFLYNAIEKLGINISAPITGAYPIVSVILAIVFLGENLPFLGFFGVFLVILGGIMVSSTQGDHTRSFQKRHLVFPVMAAFCFGVSQVVRKPGIELVPLPIMAAAVTATSSWIVLALFLAFALQYRHFQLNQREITYLSLSGLATSIAIPLLYLAIRTGNIVIVVPFGNLSPLFSLFLSRIFFRKEEIFSLQVIGATILVVIGVVFLSIFH